MSAPTTTAEGFLRYLLPLDLLNLAATCRHFCLSPEVKDIVDQIWGSLALTRWHISPKTLEAYSSHTMKEVYMLYDDRMRVPEGKYTSTGHTLFGRGRVGGICGWLFLGHTPNAQLKVANLNDQAYHSLELRICVQNLSHGQITVPAHLGGVTVKALPGEDRELNPDLPVQNIHVISKNGEFFRSEADLHLRAFEFGVISLEVCGPVAVKNEPEFVTMIQSIVLEGTSGLHSYDDEQQSWRLEVQPMAEDRVWGCYTSLPNGVVLLRAR